MYSFIHTYIHLSVINIKLVNWGLYKIFDRHNYVIENSRNVFGAFGVYIVVNECIWSRLDQRGLNKKTAKNGVWWLSTL